MTSPLADAIRLFEIMGVNILLSGDNAVVVGMAIRSLPSAQRRAASAAGISIAVLLQIVATLTVARVLLLPVIALPGGILLCAIAIGLLHDNGGPPQPAVRGHSRQGLLASITTVIVAYFVMCPDNILAIAAIGRGHPWLLTAGLLLSVGVIFPASLVIATLMRRFPLTLTAGAGILGWIGGSVMAGALSRLDHLTTGPVIQFLIPVLAVIIVVTSPWWWRAPVRSCPPADSIKTDTRLS